jgi:hypothetical protein
MLTNYEITRALVAERRRDLSDEAAYTRRRRRTGRPGSASRPAPRAGFATWLATRFGGATGTASAEPNPCR